MIRLHILKGLCIHTVWYRSKNRLCREYRTAKSSRRTGQGELVVVEVPPDIKC